MAIPGYMSIRDEQGTTLQSNATVSGREGTSEILSFRHQVYIPCDHDTGVLTGTRKHEPFIITKNFCPITPLLNKACCSGKTYQNITLRWYRINDLGSEEEYFRHELNHVKVVAVKPVVMDVKDKTKEQYGHQEEVHFRYETIRWLYLDGNITAEDTWRNRQ